MQNATVYTPAQVAEILQISKSTVYELIENGELIAKKIGRVYRIPKNSISFVFSGLDEDILAAEKVDLENLPKINKALNDIRTKDNV
jgi:excisionase family DNA binding protein